MSGGEPPPLAREVVEVDSDEVDAETLVLGPVPLERGRFGLTRDAPRGPEVEDDRMAAQRIERHRARTAELRERERGRRRADRRGVLLVRELPDEEREQSRHAGERDDLRATSHSAGHDFNAAWMYRTRSPENGSSLTG